jgi:hypothetical protein
MIQGFLHGEEEEEDLTPLGEVFTGRIYPEFDVYSNVDGKNGRIGDSY